MLTTESPTTKSPAETLREQIIALVTAQGPLSAGEIASITKRQRSDVRNAAHRLIGSQLLVQRRTRTNHNRGGVSIYGLPSVTDNDWRIAIDRVKNAESGGKRDWFKRKPAA